MLEGLLSFTDKEYWDAELKRYVDCNAHSCGDNGGVWEYFKHCLRTENRYFFKNPLIPIIEKRFKERLFNLPFGTQLYRARIDTNREYEKQCWIAKDYDEIQKADLSDKEKENPSLAKSIEEYWKRKAESIINNSEYQKFLKRQTQGFEGFDAKGSGAPPYEVVEAGRCNPEKVSFLYAASDSHTAVAEVRPYMRDAVSVATLSVKKDLRLVDFYYEYDKNGIIMIDDSFFHKMRTDFSSLNKGNKEDYLVTQYLSLLAQNLGFDGIRFRSSLVRRGTNYVIFDNENCEPIASKIYVVSNIEYSLFHILEE